MSHDDEDGSYGELEVLRSNAGFYIGRLFTNGPDSEFPGLVEPGSRESGYFGTEGEAARAFEQGFVPRDCVENNFAYDQGVVPDLREGNR